MIDEELYKLATNELNSDARKPDVWARACALASDDHDEARFLYTNLRVEEMLSKDGKQRTFSPSRQRDDTDPNGDDELDSLEVSLTDEPAPASRQSGLSNNDDPLPIEFIDGFEPELAENHTSVAGTATPLSSDVLEFDDETMSELDSLTELNNNTDNARSSITGNPVLPVLSKDTSPNTLETPSTNDIVAEVFGSSVASARAKIVSPEEQKTSELAHKLERQVQIMDESVPLFEDKSTTALSQIEAHDETNITAESIEADEAQTVRSDYADSTLMLDDEDETIDLNEALDTGVGRSFIVFSRRGVIKAIKRGVSWPALLFTFPWLLSKAMFGTAIVYGCLWLVSLAGLLTAGSHWLDAGSEAAIDIKLWTAAFAVLAVIGLLYLPFRYGNRWVAQRLENRGFEYEAAVSASNKRDAVDRLLRFDHLAP